MKTKLFSFTLSLSCIYISRVLRTWNKSNKEGYLIRCIWKIPEDPVNSTPDVSYFLFFYGPPVRNTMCNMVSFFENSDPFLRNYDRNIDSRIRLFEPFPHFFFKKTNSWDLCPVLNCVKMDSKIFKKKEPCCT